MNDEWPRVAERMVDEFDELPWRVGPRGRQRCADECEFASPLFLEQAARAHLRPAGNLTQRTGWPASASACLTSADPQGAEVEDRRGQDGVRAGLDRRREVLDRARRRREAITGTDDLGADQPDQLEVEAVLGAVGVHRVEQDLAGAELGRRGGPTRRRRARRSAGRRAW